METKRLVTHVLTNWREQGSDDQIAELLELLSMANHKMGLYEEGMGQAKEALEIFERLGDTKKRADCLTGIANLLVADKKLDAAEEAALRALNISSGEGLEWRLCSSHRALGDTFRSKGETEKAIHHFETAIGIASPFGWKYPLFWNHLDLTDVLRTQGRFEDAQARLEHAKSNADNAYQLAYVIKMQSSIFFRQRQLEEAKSELLRAIDAFEKLVATVEVEKCRWILTNLVNVEILSG